MTNFRLRSKVKELAYNNFRFDKKWQKVLQKGPLPAYFRFSPLQKHVRKVVVGFGKKSCVGTGVRKPGNTCGSQTGMI